VNTPDVTLIYDAGCPGADPARANLATAFDQIGVAPEWREVCRSLASDFAAHPVVGSPTILVDGSDVVPGGLAAGPSCRPYADDHGVTAMAPPVPAIVAALRRAIEPGPTQRISRS